MDGLTIVAAMWLAFAGFGAWIAAQKHRPGVEGFVLGLLFGPLGCLVEAVLPTLEARAKDDGGMVDRFQARLNESAGERERREARKRLLAEQEERRALDERERLSRRR